MKKPLYELEKEIAFRKKQQELKMDDMFEQYYKDEDLKKRRLQALPAVKKKPD